MRSLLLLLVCASLLASWGPATSGSAVLLSSAPRPQSSPSTRIAQSQAPASTPVVQIRNGPQPGSLELSVTGPTELSSELIVERQRQDGSFEAVQNLDLGMMKLVTSCDQRITACLRIDGPSLRPMPWTGMSCSSQCNRICDKNVRLDGRFRFVVRSCDGQIRFEGPVFELSKTP